MEKLDSATIGVSAQQHGLIGLDAGGVLVRPALLWNDPRSAGAAAALVDALGGPAPWVEAIGSVPSPTYTIAKLRWLAEFEPVSAKRIAEVLLPHDWLVWQLLVHPRRRTTDRGDASGTGYWSPVTGEYRQDLIELACTIEPPIERAFEHDARRRRREKGERQRREERPAQLVHQGDRDVPAEHGEGAVSQVDEIHHTQRH